MKHTENMPYGLVYMSFNSSTVSTVKMFFFSPSILPLHSHVFELIPVFEFVPSHSGTFIGPSLVFVFECSNLYLYFSFVSLFSLNPPHRGKLAEPKAVEE